MADNDLQIVDNKNIHHVEAQYVEMMVPLYSYGCERKVKKALMSHLKGIYSINIDYYQQKVTVWGICNKYGVLEMVKKKRKVARFWNPEDHKIVLDDGNPKLDMRRPESQERRRWQHRQCQLALAKVQSLSLSWKAWNWKKVFDRSSSF
ncbi:heavy metal-associated isoprenylated plant protein 36-like [Impatiens glandulifera]|uniref:heavy metal-associated isoprenylated plant protein 36-like n=1 Tax=Impatiens glandulifera TaxID=253017 RepID=UPI001FB1142A|nr:heavy metal-associated isoprenylated plant protein 36-like [Impatiens glandulifera]